MRERNLGKEWSEKKTISEQTLFNLNLTMEQVEQIAEYQRPRSYRKPYDHGERVKYGKLESRKAREATARYHKSIPKIKGELSELEKSIMEDAALHGDSRYQSAKKKTPE